MANAERPIIQISPCYVDLDRETGGVANIVRQITLGLAAHGREVHLICGNTELGVRRARAQRFDAAPTLHVHVIGDRFGGRIADIGELRRAIASVGQARVAHVHTCFSAYCELAMLELARAGASFVFTSHGKLTSGMLASRSLAKRVFMRVLTRRALLLADAIVTSGEGEARAQSVFGLPPITTTIPNGYTRPSGPAEAPPSNSTSRPYVLYLGYIDPSKNPGLLIAAFAQARTSETHDLVFVGPDAYHHQHELERVAATHSIASRVRFAGPAYGEAKWAALRGAACLCLPSRAEGQPVVLAEAMGAGIPAIYTPECNSEHITRAGAGIEVEGGDAAAWASAIDRACLDPRVPHQMRQSADRLSSELQWEAIVLRWISLYDEIDGGTHRAKETPDG